MAVLSVFLQKKGLDPLGVKVSLGMNVGSPRSILGDL